MTPATRQLDELGVAYRVVTYEHDPSADSFGEEATTSLGLDPDTVFKTLLAEVDGTLVVACVPVSGMLDLKALARAAGGKRATMADPVVAERTTGYVVGGISPLGQRKRLPTYIDEWCEASEEIHVSGGRRGLEIVIAPAALVGVLDATIVPIAG